jgi:hypothetical protein
MLEGHDQGRNPAVGPQHNMPSHAKFTRRRRGVKNHGIKSTADPSTRSTPGLALRATPGQAEHSFRTSQSALRSPQWRVAGSAASAVLRMPQASGGAVERWCDGQQCPASQLKQPATLPPVNVRFAAPPRRCGRKNNSGQAAFSEVQSLPPRSLPFDTAQDRWAQDVNMVSVVEPRSRGLPALDVAGEAGR